MPCQHSLTLAPSPLWSPLRPRPARSLPISSKWGVRWEEGEGGVEVDHAHTPFPSSHTVCAPSPCSACTCVHHATGGGAPVRTGRGGVPMRAGEGGGAHLCEQEGGAPVQAGGGAPVRAGGGAPVRAGGDAPV